MKSLTDDYLELVSLVKDHLTQDFNPQERLFVDEQSYAFFRQQAQQQMQQQKKPAAPIVPQPTVSKPTPQPTYTPPPRPAAIPVVPTPPPVEAAKTTPKVTPVETPKNEPEQPKAFFVLEPMPKSGIVDLGAVGKTFETLFPQLYISEVPKFKPESHLTFYIVNVETTTEKRTFLNQFGRALFTVFGQVKMISAEQLSTAQGIVIAPRAYEEKLTEFTGKILYLDEIDLYLKEPARKAVLWESVKSLCKQ